MFSLSGRKPAYTCPVQGIFHSAQISPNGRYIALSTGQGTNLMVLDADDGKILWQKAAHRGELKALQFSPNSQHLATGADDERVKIWNSLGGELLQELHGASGSVRCIAWSGSGAELAAGTSEGEINRWNLSKNARPGAGYRAVAGLKTGDGGGLLISGSSRFVSASGPGDSLAVFPLTNLYERRWIRGAFWPLEFMEKDAKLAACSLDGHLVVCNLAAGTVERRGPSILSGPIDSVDISSMMGGPAHILFVCTTEGRQALWNTELLAQRWIREAPRDGGGGSHPGFVGISPDGSRLICGYRKTGLLQVLNPGGELLRAWSHPTSVHAVLLSRNGQWCAVADDEGRVTVYDLRHGAVGDAPAEIAHLRVAGTPWSLAIDPQGNRLISGTTTGVVQFFATDAWRPLTFL
ncbi:MAG TPA: hypothetical protein VF607_02300, partial [Verrucomicrobiae bacterium]